MNNMIQDNAIMVAIKGAVATVAAALTAIFGGWDTLATALVLMMIADWGTGFLASAIQGRLDSGVGWKGILKKVLLFGVVCVAAVFDSVTGQQGHPLRAAACLFYIGNEGVSIVENLGRAGVPIPEKMAALFQRLKEDPDAKPEKKA